jgi:hypothetical protein
VRTQLASRTAPRSQHSSSGTNPLHLPPPTPPALAAARRAPAFRGARSGAAGVDRVGRSGAVKRAQREPRDERESASAQCCFPEPKPPARADAGRRSDAPARSKEPRRASTRRLRPREVRAGRNGRHGPRTAGANAGAPASPFSRASRGRLAPPSSGGSSASVPAAAAGRERRKERREVKGVSSGPDRCACTPASASPRARASTLSGRNVRTQLASRTAPRSQHSSSGRKPSPLTPSNPSGSGGGAEGPRISRGPERRRRRRSCWPQRRREAGAARAA